MVRPLAALLLLALAFPARPDADELALRALREDASLKIRAQAAMVLGQRQVAAAVPALRAAAEQDPAPAVRLAAVSALGRIGDPAARPTLEAASRGDADPAVRAAAARVLEELAPAAPVRWEVTLEEPSGTAGGPEARAALREALGRHLRGNGFAVVRHGKLRLKPSVVRVETDASGDRTVIAVRAALVAVEPDGRMAAMLESGARLTATGALDRGGLGAYAARALDAAARALSADLAARLAER